MLNAPLITEIPVSLARAVIGAFPAVSTAATASVEPPTENRPPGLLVRLNVYALVEPPTTEKSPTTVPTLEPSVTVALDRRMRPPPVPPVLGLLWMM